MQQKIVIGGSFNPPHLGHRNMALEALMSGEFSSVTIQVGGARSDKKRPLASPDDRVAMTQLTFPAIWHNNFYPVRFDISYYDTYGPNTVTFQLLEWYRSKYPDATIIFGIGGDLVTPHAEWNGKCEIQALWDSGEELFSHSDFLVYPRLGYPDPHDLHLPGNFRIFEGREIRQISATEVEERVRAGKDIRDLVTTGVREYIRTHKLYKGETQ